MQTSTSVGERTGGSLELRGLQHGTVTGSHPSNKSRVEMCVRLNIPLSAVGAVSSLNPHANQTCLLTLATPEARKIICFQLSNLNGNSKCLMNRKEDSQSRRRLGGGGHLLRGPEREETREDISVI